ncbi:hypothetical protein F7734_49170 [Scytonema sp. UIC 10036]|uniref:hypothetical protein n=1 Tax=Scytonema sp. UIC 10036 TaxID=2304196 RepID=UPI0012DA2F42|nr:hypothetical protein [Scytonema sp. UIC 10036]MUG99827.1 hypothetical protein [Scytonema sp. UIC 10036]
MLLNNTLTTIQSSIDSVQAQITALQAQLAELQHHQQAVMSVESACETAIAQVKTALQMLTSVSPDDINTFKTAINDVFGEDLPQLTASVDPVEPTPPTPAPAPTNNDVWGDETQPTIDVSAVAVMDAPQPESQPDSELHLLTFMELMELSSEQLKRLAKAKGVEGYRKMTKGAIAELLQDSIPANEIKMDKPQN